MSRRALVPFPRRLLAGAVRIGLRMGDAAMRKFFSSGVYCACLAVVMLCAGLPAGAEHVLQLFEPGVTHINLSLVPDDHKSTASVSGLMALRYLGLPPSDPDNSLPDDAWLLLQLQQVLDAGRALNPAFTPTLELNETMLAGALNALELDSDYQYGVIVETDYATFIKKIAAWMNTDFSGVTPHPTYAPALVILCSELGPNPDNPNETIAIKSDYTRWAVVTGTRASADPALDANADIFGLWIDDPASINFDENGMPIPSNIYYENTNSGLRTVLGAAAYGENVGKFIAVVPMAEATGNTPPMAHDGTLTTVRYQPANGTLSATDNEGDPLTFSIVQTPLHGSGVITNAATGAFTYTPADAYSGSDSFTFKANDGQADSNIATVTITVNTYRPTLDIVSADSNEVQANLSSNMPAISSDGRFVTFFSAATNLAPGDTNTMLDVFVRDRAAGTTECASVSNSGAFGNNSSQTPDISADGRYVVFTTNATNFSPSDTDAAYADIYLRDRTAGTTTLVSVSSSGVKGDRGSDMPAISATGRYVVFRSASSNFGVTLISQQIFLRDLATGVTECVSLGPGGVVANGQCTAPDVSADGRFVSFMSEATNLVSGDTNSCQDIFVRDRLAGITLRISVATDGTQGNANSNLPKMANDGSLVAFQSAASTLVPGDTNGKTDIFVRNLTSGVTTRISTAADGAQGDNHCLYLSVTSDGRYVAFASIASNLTPGDTNNQYDIFVKDLQTGAIRRVNVSQAGAQANNTSNYPAISDGGVVVAFYSLASNLVLNDTNNTSDIFAFDQHGATNHPPAAQDGTLATDRNQPAAGTLLATDADGDPLTYCIITNGALGTATITNAATGAYTYTPNHNATGADAFTFRANDGMDDSNLAAITVTINDVNHAPVAQDKAMPQIAGNEPYHGTLTATDADNDTLTFSIVGEPAKGTVTVDPATGAFTYTADSYSYGADSFTFKANDGREDSNIATVTLAIYPTVIHVSTAGNDGNDGFTWATAKRTIQMGLNVALIGGEVWVAEGIYPEYVSFYGYADLYGGFAGNELTREERDWRLHETIMDGQNAHVMLEIQCAYGVDFTIDGLTFTHGRGGNGGAVSLYGGYSTPTFSHNRFIDNTAVGGGGGLYSRNSDPQLHDNVFLRNTAAGDGGGVLIDGAASASRRTVLVNNSFLDNTATSGHGASLCAVSGRVDITNSILWDNGRPTDDLGLLQNSQVTVTASDVGGGESGVFTDGTGALTWGAGNIGGDPLTVTGEYHLTGNSPCIDAGSDAAVVPEARDIDNEPRIRHAYVDIGADETEPNSRPVAEDGTLTVDEDTAGTGTLVASDADGDPLTFSIVTNGSLGTAAITDAVIGAYSYTPNPNAHGADAFTFMANDGKADSNVATISVTINSANDAPVAQDGMLTTAEHWPAGGNLAATDIDGDALTFSIVTDPAHGTVALTAATGAFIYTPASGYLGGDSFTFAANDGATDSNAATITISVAEQMPTNIVSVDSNEILGNKASERPSISGDGRYVVFFSDATNLVPGDTNGWKDVFVRDTVAGTTERVSVASDGTQGDADSPGILYGRGISADGRYVVFQSFATNLAPGDTNGVADIYLRDRQAGVTTRISLAPGSVQPNASCINPSISPNGRYVVFESTATNLVDGGAAGIPQLYRYDRDTGEIICTSRRTDGVFGDGEARNGEVTNTGEVFWASAAANLGPLDGNGSMMDIYRRDAAGAFSIISLTADDQPANSFQTVPAVSDDGKVVAFNSLSSNLLPGDGNGQWDIYARNLATGTLTRVSVSTSGGEPDSYSFDCRISGDGRFVVFTSGATNLTAGDTNGLPDIFVRDLLAGATRLVSMADDGAPSNDGSLWGAISADSRFVTFQSAATNLAANDTNGATDIFLADMGANHPPVAQDGTLVTDEDVSANGALVATDADGDPLTFSIVTNGALGMAVVTDVATGAYTYTPNTDANGSDSFTFKANDGYDDSNIATIAVTINPVCDAKPDALIMRMGGSVLVGDNIYHDLNAQTDAQNAPLRFPAYYAVVAQNDAAMDDTLTITGPVGSDGWTISYFDNISGTGADITGQVIGEGWPTGTLAPGALVAILVKVAATETVPVGTVREDIFTISSNADGTETTDQVRARSTAVDSTQADAMIRLQDSGEEYLGNDIYSLTAVGETRLQNIAAGRTLTYDVKVENDGTAAADYRLRGAASGSGCTLNYFNADTGEEKTAEMITTTGWVVTLAPGGGVNIRAVVTADGTLTTGALRNMAITARLVTDNMQGDTVIVRHTVTTNGTPVAQDGMLTADEDVPATGMLIATDADGDPLTFSIVTNGGQGTAAITDAAAGAYTYTPNPNANGADTFTFKANDGLSDSNTATVTVTINPVNDPPTANPQDVTVDEGATVAITLTGSDADGDPLTFATGTPEHGALTGTAPTLTYTPNAGYDGPDSFTFTVNDGTVASDPATVSITVNPVNHAPVAYNQETDTNEDISVDGTLKATDADGDALTFRIVAEPEHGTVTVTAETGNFTYMPELDYNGPDHFRFVANDGLLDSNEATVAIFVSQVNDPPTAIPQEVTTEEDTAVAITLTGSDPDGDPLTFAVNLPSHGTLTGILTNLTYTPEADFNGLDSFTFTVNDGEYTSEPATVSITVTPANDPPVADARTVSTDEDTPVAIMLTASDPDNDTLVFTVVTPPAHGAVTGEAPSITYTPEPNYYGPDSVTFKASDGLLDSNLTTVSITVKPVNDAPQAVDDAYEISGLTLTVPAPGVLGNDSDIEGTALTAALAGDPLHGTVTMNADGSLTYTRNSGYHGSDTFLYKASDGELESNLAVVTITTAANAAHERTTRQ